MRRQGHFMALAMTGALLTGCAVEGDAPPAADEVPLPVVTGANASSRPESLVGSWTLAGVGEKGAGTILRLASHDLYVFGSRCGTLSGSWQADVDGVFVAKIFGASTITQGIPGCERASEQTPRWLRRVVAYRFDGRVAVLLDGLGQPVTRLIPGATPTPVPELATTEVEPPVVTEQFRRAVAPAAELPATLIPADRQRLMGRWIPVDGHRAAYVELAADGEWRASDGCNDQAGRWISAPRGTLLSVAGPVTLAACDNVPVGSWLWAVRRAGFDGEILVFLDAQAGETGRLRRVG